MSSEVFIISAVTAADPSEAIRLAVEATGVIALRLQDAVFGSDGSVLVAKADEIARKAGLGCRVVVVSPGLRAIFFAAQSVLSGDVDLVGVVGLHAGATTAFVMASPEAVGRQNLMPRARLASRSLSLAGSDSALRLAGITSSDIAIFKEGDDGIALVNELIEELEARQVLWGMVSANELALLVERV